MTEQLLSVTVLITTQNMLKLMDRKIVAIFSYVLKKVLLHIKSMSCFLSQMHQQGILKTDDLITRFFRLCTEMCVDLCYRALGEQAHTHTSQTLTRAKCFHTLDAFVRLIALLVKHSGETTNTVTKLNLLNKVIICQ